jgi:hypothetical protein
MIDWGHELLSPAEQMLLRRLAVFSGGWTIEAAVGVCSGDGLPEYSIVTLLLQLVDKSHVVAEEHQGEVRYRLLETMRQYALEKLREAREESALHVRHLDWFAHLAELGEEPLWGPHLRTWFERLRVESHNLRAALEWSVAASSHGGEAPTAVESGLRLGGALWHFWDLQGYASEGRVRLLQLLRTGGSPAARAKAFHAAGYLTYSGGNLTEGSRLAGEALAYSREHLDPFLYSSATVGLSLGALAAGDATRAAAPRRRWTESRGRATKHVLRALRLVEVSACAVTSIPRFRDGGRTCAHRRAARTAVDCVAFHSDNLTLARGELGRAETLQREASPCGTASAVRSVSDEATTRWGGSPRTSHRSARAARLFVPPTHP